MKVNTALLIVASAGLASGCEPCVSCCADVQTGLRLSVHDSEGRNMFDSATPGYFHKDSIHLFTLLETGQLDEQYNPQMEIERNFEIRNLQSGETYMNVYPELHGKVEKTQMTSTVIKWSAHDSDTIDFEIAEKCYDIRLKTAWYNGRLAIERPVEVTK